MALKSSAEMLFKASFCTSVIDAANMLRASNAVMLLVGFGVEAGAVVTAKVKGDGSAAVVEPEPFKIASATWARGSFGVADFSTSCWLTYRQVSGS